ncbi:MAG: zf-HC2 domain-containing protein [candidate division KSB1 bacterium]|nr:zf-HC2 domain-containing protein [candidate division KSB1 bacterium]
MRSCEKYRKQLSALMDGELSDEKKKAVAAHLADCEACRRILADWQLLYKRLAPSKLLAPPFFADKVRNRIFAQASKQPVVRLQALPKLIVSAAAVAGIVAGIFLGARLDFETSASRPYPDAVITELFELDDAPLTTAYWSFAELSQ